MQEPRWFHVWLPLQGAFLRAPTTPSTLAVPTAVRCPPLVSQEAQRSVREELTDTVRKGKLHHRSRSMADPPTTRNFVLSPLTSTQVCPLSPVPRLTVLSH
jgi:hypothetical protein